MPPIDFFICSETQIRACGGWNEAANSFSATGINLPDESALTSLAHLLIGEDVFPVLRLEGDVEHIYKFMSNVTKSIGDASYEELKDVGAKWAELPPWSEVDVNPMDLAGFLIHLKSLWHQSHEPDKAVFLWPNE